MAEMAEKAAKMFQKVGKKLSLGKKPENIYTPEPDPFHHDESELEDRGFCSSCSATHEQYMCGHSKRTRIDMCSDHTGLTPGYPDQHYTPVVIDYTEHLCKHCIQVRTATEHLEQLQKSVKERKRQSRLLKLAEDEQRTDGTSIKDTDLNKWIAPPISWGYENLIHIAVKRFREFLEIIGPKDPRIKVTDPQKYFSLGAQLFSLEIIKLFTLYLARTSSGMLDDRITVKTVQGYISNTISAAYRCTGKKQLEPEERKQVFVYIGVLGHDGELSNKVRPKHVATSNDLDLLVDAAFSDAYSLSVKSIRVVLNMALYMNLFVDVCGRGSDLAWGGPMISEQENHCLCWNHCHFYVVNVDDGDRVIAANIDIKYQKGQRRKDLQKTVTLRLLPVNMAMQDSLRLLATLALVDGVFGPGVSWSSILAIDPGELQIKSGPHTREIRQSDDFIEVPVFRFEHNAVPYTLRRGYANMLYLRASAEDRRFLMGHKTNSEIYSNYHSAISMVHVQELFRDVRAVNNAEMVGLSLNRIQHLPETISPEGWQTIEQDTEVIQYSLETSQMRTSLSELYGSIAAAVRSSDQRVRDLIAATARLKNRRRVLLRRIYGEEYRKLFTDPGRPPVPTPSTPMMMIDHHSWPDLVQVDDPTTEDSRDWLLHLEQEEESAAQELADYQTIVAEEPTVSDVEIGGPNSSLMVMDDVMPMPTNHSAGLPLQLAEGSDMIRLHKINDGSARPKNMTIARVREAMSSGGLTDAALSDIMVEVFSATHRSGKYIPGEEPVLGTSICRFSGVDLSLDWHAPETAHSAHATVLRHAANEAFEKHLLPLDVPCTYYSQGPTKRKNPKLCQYNKFKTRRQQINHVWEHTLQAHKRHHEVGNIPHGEWHCYYKGCAVLTSTPSDAGKVPKVLLSTTSVFMSKQSYLSHLYEEHRLSPRAIEPVLWCGICEHFLGWVQFGTAHDEHFEMHWDEVWSLVMEYGYTGQFDNGRRTIPSFCPFCLHDENLSPVERISKTMNLLSRGDYQKHIAAHFDGVDSGSILPCPCFPKTCSYQGEMTPAELENHLRTVHGIGRVEVSRSEARKNLKVLSERPANVQGGVEEERLLKKARNDNMPPKPVSQPVSQPAPEGGGNGKKEAEPPTAPRRPLRNSNKAELDQAMSGPSGARPTMPAGKAATNKTAAQDFPMKASSKKTKPAPTPSKPASTEPSDDPHRNGKGKQREQSDEEGQDETPSKDKPKKVKKGASVSRRRPSQPKLVESPGNIKKGVPFIDIPNNEQKLGSYMGFNDVTQLRALAMSWPVLKASIRFDVFGANMNKKTALRFLDDNEALFTGVNPDINWPLGPSPSTEIKSRHLACLLSTMKSEVESLTENSSDFNRQQQDIYAAAFAHRFMGREIPSIGYEDSHADGKVLSFSPPITGPYEQETRLEVFNRLWNLLRYVRYCFNNTQWEQKFSSEAMLQRCVIDISHVPQWLRPPEAPPANIATLIQKSVNVQAADQLEPLDITIIWEAIRFDGIEDLEDALVAAKEANIPQPTRKQRLLADPRLFSSIEAFRDAIRRQYNCHEIKMDIRSLELTFISEDGVKETQDVFRAPWPASKSTFESPSNKDFGLHVTFEALDDPSSNIFESFEPPPEIAGLFDTSSGDVRVNEAGVASIVAAAFDGTSGSKDGAQPPTNEVSSIGRSYLDIIFSQGGGINGIGAPPDPMKRFGSNKIAFLQYYDGMDVTEPETRRQWQKKLFMELSQNAKTAILKVDKVARDLKLTSAERSAIQTGEELGTQLAIAQEGVTIDVPLTEESEASSLREDDYYTMRSAFSGLNSRAGPELDVCLQLLDCEQLSNGRYQSRLFKDRTGCSFFNYQITGIVGILLKLYGKIDAERLLAATNSAHLPCAKKVHLAAGKLEHLLIHGAILADEVGLGKTKQALMVALIHVVLDDSMDPTGKERIFRPILLVVPPSLVNQWLCELRLHWPGFRVVMSYEEHEYKDMMQTSSLSYSAMSQYPHIDTLPANLRFIFDQKDPRAANVLILTSYETHKNRTARRKTKVIPGVPFKPPRFNDKGAPVWKRKPRKKHYWVTQHTGTYSLLAGDECQKVKNTTTGLWAVLHNQAFRKIVLLTATPMHNTIKDLIALLLLLWPMIETELQVRVKLDPSISEWFADIYQKELDLITELSNLPACDTRRLALLDPRHLRQAAASSEVHIQVAKKFRPILDLVLIQRSTSSVLPMEIGDPVSLRPLFRKMTTKTAIVKRLPAEEPEYQYFHRQYANEYVQEFQKQTRTEKIGRPMAMSARASVCGGAALRKLAMLNCSTILARLNLVMQSVEGNTHVATLDKWRSENQEADFIQDLTRGEGEPRSQTAADLVRFLTKGSPTLRLLFQVLLTYHVLDPLNKPFYKHHQKLIYADTVPANAYYVEKTLRAGLVDARTMHSGLSNNARSELVDLFNDPESSLKVLILLQDVGAIGFNMHISCNVIVFGADFRSYPQEAQAGGRINRVTSEFPGIAIKKSTPNSHDQFRSSRQTGKATVMLAANSQDPAIRNLLIRLLNEFQPRVNACHESQDGQEMLKEIQEKQNTRDVAIAVRMEEMKRQRREDQLKKQASKETRQLDVTNAESSTQGSKRTRKTVERFSLLDYDGKTGALLQPEERERRHKEATQQESFCEVCYRSISDENDTVTCSSCCTLGHAKCLGIALDEVQVPLHCQKCRMATLPNDKSTFEESVSRGEDDDDSSGPDEEDDEDDEYVDEGDHMDSDYDLIPDAASEEEFLASSEDGDDEEDFLVDTSLEAARELTREKKDEKHLRKLYRLNDFLSEEQPDDETRERAALLQLDPYVTWRLEDLEQEDCLQLALHLLYNRMQGNKNDGIKGYAFGTPIKGRRESCETLDSSYFDSHAIPKVLFESQRAKCVDVNYSQVRNMEDNSFAIAGYFKLKIYIISLNSPSMDEENLGTLFSELPKQCVVLLEDIDTAGLTHTRDEKDSDSKPLVTTMAASTPIKSLAKPKARGGKISLSALLNILDGVASQEGRVLIMTTNHIEKLDEALIRPGRVDMMVKFDLASTEMLSTIFRAIFATLEGDIPRSSKLSIRAPKPATTEKEKLDEKQREEEERKRELEFQEKKRREEEKVKGLAEEFAQIIPTMTFSPAEIQGYCLKYKRAPEAAVKNAAEWVKTMRTEKIKEKEKKEKEEEEKAQKEKEEEEKARKEKEEESSKAKEAKEV
ncbi:hypothetical protein G7Y89_g2010 [Cudoniella acicularis]|uniref:Helicase ATP-binding domain-containing protein n=1 Tax=Cudoniella acicularis TaxID=354080 RepID=A0A8H4RUZ4_9HELO|nr:hypothetical protein G7Y89_g2010 [Cudoniella acicularis]